MVFQNMNLDLEHPVNFDLELDFLYDLFPQVQIPMNLDNLDFKFVTTWGIP